MKVEKLSCFVFVELLSFPSRLKSSDCSGKRFGGIGSSLFVCDWNDGFAKELITLKTKNVES